jgi:transmembrane E3 ubiquitin-protein ligase
MDGRMEGPRVVLLVILLLFILFSPEPKNANNRQFPNRFGIPQQLLGVNLTEELEVLRASRYGDLNAKEEKYLDLTGFRQNDGYLWELLPVAQNVAKGEFLDVIVGSNRSQNDQAEYDKIDNSVLPVYRNVTGEVRGRISKVGGFHPVERRINLTELVPGNDYITGRFDRNFTEDAGDIAINFKESYEDGKIKAYVAIETESSPSNGWQVKMEGFHQIKSGYMFMTTDSEKYDANFGLPHLAWSASAFVEAKRMANKTMTEYVDKRDGFRPHSYGTLFAVPQCEYVMWLQQHPVSYAGVTSQQTINWLDLVEQELTMPDGAPIGEPPAMTFSAVLFSPDCGYILKSEMPLTGLKAEVYSGLTRRLIVAFILILAIQVVLMKRQMQEAATPSTKSRVAYHTFAIMAMGDGQMAAGIMGLVLIDDSIWLLCASAAFICLVNVSFLETRFIYEIWQVQVGEPAQREYERQRAARAAAGVNIAPANGELPLPATAARPVDTGATPIILPPDQDIEAAAVEDRQRNPVTRAAPPVARTTAFSAIYSQFYFMLVALMFLSIWASTWPAVLRTFYANTLATVYLSFWLPQIYRNTIRNCRKALSWEYVVGISALRLTPIVYWYLQPRNLLHVEVHPMTAYLFIGYVWLQVAVLAVQYLLGPRLLVSDEWLPAAYDYHPLLREDGDEEAGKMLPIGFVASASEAKDKDSKEGNRKIFDCAICMNEIDVPVIAKGDTSNAWLEQRRYMVTPCRHIFHTECLEGWMNLRLVCPVCREGLPPI